MKKFGKIFFIIIPVLLTVFMICDPQSSLTAARDGFTLWYSVLLPALLPFFIVADLLASTGFIRLMGNVLEPVMRPIFRLPGCASLVIVMGFTSGFPVGAVLSRRLYHDGMLTADETERLVAFTNNSSPLFIIGAVGVGLFGSPVLGYVLALGHYCSNLLLGIALRFKASARLPVKAEPTLRTAPVQTAANSPGQILSSSIKNSLNNIIAIAGFVIIFSVLTRMLISWGFIDAIAILIAKLLGFLHLPWSVAYGMGMGIFEITIGTRAVSLAPHGEILCKMAAVSSILAFSGFSIIAQVTGLLSDTPVRPIFYLGCRLMQIALSVPITIIAYHCLAASQAVPSLAPALQHALYSFDAWSYALKCLLLALVLLFILLMTSLAWSRD